MFILRNGKNQEALANGAPEDVPLAGDVILSADLRKSYVVGPDGAHHRLLGEEHEKAVVEYKRQRVALAERREEERRVSEAVMAKLMEN